MKFYQHDSYKEYKEAQIKLNVKKIHNSRPKEVLSGVCQYIKKHMDVYERGLCHGVRNGWEVAAFRKLLSADVIGTDISYTANKFKNVIEWDFHNIKEEWIDSFDFIYSNSLDHSHSPEYAVYQWSRCLKENGLIFVEWAQDKLGGKFNGNAADCFGATQTEYRTMFTNLSLLKDEFKYREYTYYVLHKKDIECPPQRLKSST